MPYSFSAPDDLGDIRASELHTSLEQSLDAQAGETFMSGARTLGRIGDYAQAEGRGTPIGPFAHQEYLARRGIETGGLPPEDQAPQPPLNTEQEIPIADAAARVKQEGLTGQLKLPDQGAIRPAVLNLMIQDAHERADYNAAVSRGPQVAGALGALTSIGVGMIDPVNDALFAIPVLGEARWGQMLTRAGDSILARGGVRALQGASQGAVGGAAMVPADWWLKTQDGQDYTFADALSSVVMSAGMGAAFHAGFGGIGDVRARLRGAPLPGSPEDLVTRGLMGGTHVPAEALADEGIPEEEIPGISPQGKQSVQFNESVNPESAAPPLHPAEVLAELPPAAREDVTRAAIADVIAGRPVRAAELLQEAAKEDPRIAESIEAWHGSPHDFERFDASRIGTGEGAQSYGHGLYLAENETVARQYQKTTSYRDFIRKVKELYDEFDSPSGAREAIDESKDFSPSQRELLKALEEDDFLGFDYPHQAVAAAIKEPGAFDMSERTHAALRNLGNLYKVHIAADREHFLDWDKSIKEQSEHVRATLQKLFPSGKTSWGYELKTGEDVVRALGSEMRGDRPVTSDHAAAAQALREAGIPGIKYLDQRSRREGEGTHNFVVFDDKLIRITHKNGKEVGLDEMKAARPESVPGPAPGTLRTGRPNVDAVLADPIVADAIANGPVNRANDVPYEAGASNGADPTTNLDRHLPRVAELPSGKSFDPAIPAKIHEQVEKRAMELLIARKKAEVKRELTQAEINKIYEISHHEYAEPAEDAWYRAQGLDIDEVNAWWGKQDKITEHENPKNPPPDLYRKPYPHNKVEGVKHEETGAAAEWPTTASVEGAGAGDNVVAVRPRRAGGPRARPEATHSLLEHIAANGGLREDDAMIPDVRASLGRKNHFVPGFGNLIRKPAARSGARAPMSLYASRESAVHHGYLEDKGEISGGVSTSSVNDLLEAIDREASGNRVYRRGVEPPRAARDEAQHQHELNNALEKGLSDYGVDLGRIPSKTRDRTLEIMDKEGVTDPLDAYERAVMETDHDGTEAGKFEPFAEALPGWDKPDDAGAAPGAGEPAAGGPETGSAGAGEPARDAGQGDRAAGPDAAANRGVADWKSLETPHGPVDDPDLAAVSREAEKSPEPASVEPTKAVSAAEAEAAKADQLLADIMPTLSKDERETFEKALAELKTDRDAREQIVRDGAACLAAAAA